MKKRKEKKKRAPQHTHSVLQANSTSAFVSLFTLDFGIATAELQNAAVNLKSSECGVCGNLGY